MYELIEYEDEQEQALRLAEIVSAQICEILAQKSQATVAFAGGSTPALFLKTMAVQKLDWSKIRIVPTDERCVATKHERSNLGMMQACFAGNADAIGNMVSLFEENKELYQIEKEIEDILPLDVCVLGMGTDMHTASLFPQADQLADALSLDCPQSVMAITEPKSREKRHTLTARVLRSCPHLHLLLKGREKRTTLEKAAEQTSETIAPIRIAFRETAPLLQVHYTEE